MKRGGGWLFVTVLASVVFSPAAVCQVVQLRTLDSVTVRLVPYVTVAHPGDQLPLALVLDHPRGFHSWPHQPLVPAEFKDVNVIATTISFGALDGAEVGEIQWPAGQDVTVRYTRTPVKLLAYAGRTVVFVPLRITRSEAGRVSVPVGVTYQPCDEQLCYAPKRASFLVRILVAPGSDRGKTADAALFEAYRGPRPATDHLEPHRFTP